MHCSQPHLFASSPLGWLNVMEDGNDSSDGSNWWQSTFDEYSLDNYTYYNDNNTKDCCEGGDVCDLNEAVNFEALFIPVLCSVTFVVGILGNGALVGVLFRSRRTWSVADIFILHLGIADFLLMLTLPLWATQSADEWKFGLPICKMAGSLYTVNFYSGIFLLACISLDRYFSIVHATQMYSRRKPWIVHASCLVVWYFSLILSIPDWIFLDVLPDRLNRQRCFRNYAKFGVEDMGQWIVLSRSIFHAVGFLIPSAVLIFCYSSIFYRLRSGNQNLQKQRACKVIMAVVAVFFICWTPFNITLFVDTVYHRNQNDTCQSNAALDKARAVTQSFGYIHCSLNPILYAFLGVKFRRQLLDILRSLGCKLKVRTKLHSAISSRRTSIWSESGDTSNSIAI
ncbi:C-X-C chemokine receptor type 3.1 isoform X2 [Oryzias melastigma]|uniref:C-X-C chemokine receptor type 3.1 isoform X2 n=1 Tax=Oryzias melastigma TaxID=30732 RepID=UPI000CF7C9C8|nr:C-X-C chemokine receptor type 3.1 isoform X2 [Oryzias melastigma]